MVVKGLCWFQVTLVQGPAPVTLGWTPHKSTTKARCFIWLYHQSTVSSWRVLFLSLCLFDLHLINGKVIEIKRSPPQIIQTTKDGMGIRTIDWGLWLDLEVKRIQQLLEAGVSPPPSLPGDQVPRHPLHSPWVTFPPTLQSCSPPTTTRGLLLR